MGAWGRASGAGGSCTACGRFLFHWKNRAGESKSFLGSLREGCPQSAGIGRESPDLPFLEVTSKVGLRISYIPEAQSGGGDLTHSHVGPTNKSRLCNPPHRAIFRGGSLTTKAFGGVQGWTKSARQKRGDGGCRLKTIIRYKTNGA